MKRILVIEDEPQTRENLATILEMEGFEPLTAPNGRVGLERARRELPDLILCDVMMPELDGHGVVEALRRDPETAGIPFIFLTAKAELTDLRVGMNLGADDYLVKPATADDLLAAIAARLERQQQQARFKPDFSSAAPLEQKLGLTPREAEVLLWIAQGKANGEIATILGMAEKTVKIHAGHIFEKLGVDNRNAASLEALEALSSSATPRHEPRGR